MCCCIRPSVHVHHWPCCTHEISCDFVPNIVSYRGHNTNVISACCMCMFKEGENPVGCS